jgi:hypothetical protein
MMYKFEIRAKVEDSMISVRVTPKTSSDQTATLTLIITTFRNDVMFGKKISLTSVVVIPNSDVLISGAKRTVHESSIAVLRV